MPAKTGKERSQALRDREREQGIEKLVLKLTAKEREWIQQGQDICGFVDHTELILEAVKEYIAKRAEN